MKLSFLGLLLSAALPLAWAANSPTLSERIVELLVSTDQSEQLAGNRLLESQRSTIVEALLGELQSTSPKSVEAAAYELGVIFSPWAQGRDSSRRFIQFTDILDVRRPVERPANIPEAERIREALKNAFERLKAQADASPTEWFRFFDALKTISSSLSEFTDDRTVDWAIEELVRSKSPTLAEPLFILVEEYLGCPEVFRANGICGNSSEAEVKQFMQEEAAAMAKSLAQLKAKWGKYKSMTDAQRIGASIEAWRSKIIPIMRQYSGSYIHEGWLIDDLTPMIRFGKAALPQLRAQRNIEGGLGERAVWEYLIAAISGETDEKTVRELMKGSDPQREMACEIIAVSGQKVWASDLESLKLVNGYHLGKASQTIAACMAQTAIPILERIHALYPKESNTEYALAELKARAEQGKPRRRVGVR